MRKTLLWALSGIVLLVAAAILRPRPTRTPIPVHRTDVAPTTETRPDTSRSIDSSVEGILQDGRERVRDLLASLDEADRRPMRLIELREPASGLSYASLLYTIQRNVMDRIRNQFGEEALQQLQPDQLDVTRS